jgi:hypothetical protein
LITAHRILIGAAVAFFLFYAGRALVSFQGGGGPWALVQSIVSGGIAIGLVAYYRTLSRWGRRP